ncbi:MAG: hypothetical protein SFY80_08270 [Verrucomicrobiota bacterium]|nr:hypothetical protein [Verrucomicrobiota bacterium]
MRTSSLISWGIATAATSVAVWLALHRNSPVQSNLTGELLKARTAIQSFESSLAANQKAYDTLSSQSLTHDKELAALKAQNTELLQAQRRAVADAEIALNGLEAARKETRLQADEIRRLKRELITATIPVDEQKAEGSGQKAEVPEILAEGTTSPRTESTPGEFISTPVDVFILSIANDGTTFAINVGLDKGLHEGMLVDVQRGDTRLGRATLGAVRADFAVARPVATEYFTAQLHPGEPLTITTVHP